jgi:4-amino-4-deoxy-L-arabinose transferase-like glycosyltransferase
MESTQAVPPPGRSPGWPGSSPGALALLAWCLLLYLPGFFSLPTIDRDEARFAQASRQMLESRSARAWIVPKVQGRERLNKPPMAYWTQALSAGVITRWDASQDAIWMYRIPSLVAAILTVLATWRIGCALFPGAVGVRTGLLAGFLLAVAPIFVWEARQARADQLHVLWTTLVMWLLASIWTTRDRRQPQHRTLMLWLFIGVAGLTKGPITLMVLALTVLALCWWGRSWSLVPRLRAGSGLLIALAVVLPWIALVGSEVGLGHFGAIVYDELLGRSFTPKEGHFGPPGYHTLFAPILFLPGAMLLGAAVWRSAARSLRLPPTSAGQRNPLRRVLRFIGRAARARATARRDAELFLLAWVAPSWIAFELVVTKLPHYTMPLYPAIALLTARALCATAGGFMKSVDERLVRAGIRLWATVGLGVFTLGPLFVGRLVGATARSELVLVVPSTLVATVLWLYAIASVRAGSLARGQATGLVVAAISLVSALGVVLPHGPAPFLSQRLASEIRQTDPDGQLPLASFGFHEDSLVFETRGRVERLHVDQLDSWLAGHSKGLLILPAELMAARPDLTPRAAVSGFNYSKGQWGEWALAELAPGP